MESSHQHRKLYFYQMLPAQPCFIRYDLCDIWHLVSWLEYGKASNDRVRGSFVVHIYLFKRIANKK